MQTVIVWPLLLEHERRPTRISTKALRVDIKKRYEAKVKEASRGMFHPKRS